MDPSRWPRGTLYSQKLLADSDHRVFFVYFC
jgi:hypothetical protein